MKNKQELKQILTQTKSELESFKSLMDDLNKGIESDSKIIAEALNSGLGDETKDIILKLKDLIKKL